MTDVLHNQLDTTDQRLTGNQTYTVMRPDDRRIEIARQIALGRSNVQIAEALECTPQTVSNVRNNPVIMAIIETFRGERNEKVSAVIDEIVDVAPAAIKLLEKTIKADMSVDDETGAKLTEMPTLDQQIKSSLGIANMLPKQDNTIGNGQLPVDSAALTRIKQKAIQIRSNANLVAEDAEYKDV